MGGGDSRIRRIRPGCAVCAFTRLPAAISGRNAIFDHSRRSGGRCRGGRRCYERDERAGKTKSAFIVEAIDEKLGLAKNRKKTIRQIAGWLTHEEAEELRTSLDVFNQINEGDWP